LKMPCDRERVATVKRAYEYWNRGRRIGGQANHCHLRKTRGTRASDEETDSHRRWPIWTPRRADNSGSSIAEIRESQRDGVWIVKVNRSLSQSIGRDCNDCR